MIIKNKNKIKSKTTSKILVLGLILIALVGFLSPAISVSAQTTDNPNDKGTCTFNKTVTYDQCYTWNVNGGIRSL